MDASGRQEKNPDTDIKNSDKPLADPPSLQKRKLSLRFPNLDAGLPGNNGDKLCETIQEALRTL